VLHQLPVGEQQQLLVELLLALEVPVQEARGDLRDVRDLLHAGALVAALGEHLGGRLEQPLAAYLGLQALTLRSLGHHQNIRMSFLGCVVKSDAGVSLA